MFHRFLFFLFAVLFLAPLSATASDIAKINADWVSGYSSPPQSGVNRLLTVMVMGESTGSFEANAVTYGGQPMQPQIQRTYVKADTTGSYTYVGFFTLKEDKLISATTTGEITVGWSTTPVTSNSVYSMFWSGVDQENPITSTIENGAQGGTISTSPLSAASGDMILMGGATQSAKDINVPADFTIGFEVNSPSTTWGSRFAASKVSSGSTVTPSFTQVGVTDQRMVLCAMVMKKAIAIDPFLCWSGNAGFDIDTNNDGVDNGLAWLLGASSPYVQANSPVSVSTQTGGNLTLTFKMLPALERGGAKVMVEHSSDLGISDHWTPVNVPDVSGDSGNVTFAVTGTNPLMVVATIPSSQAVSGKLFARLKAERTPLSTQFFQQGEHQLVVYQDVPGLEPSEHYRIHVKSAATSGQWQYVFPLMTKNFASQAQITRTGASGKENYFGHSADWTHTYGNIEMNLENSPVDVEISRADGTPIRASGTGVRPTTTLPVNKAENLRFENGKVYFTLPKPVQITVDIEGQMDQDTGPDYEGPPIHAVSLFANPILTDKPVIPSVPLTPSADRVILIPAGTPREQYPTADSTYDTLVFGPGVHDFTPDGVSELMGGYEEVKSLSVRTGKKYYIPGDAIIYGTFTGSSVSNVKIYGHGTISGDRTMHPRYTHVLDPIINAPGFDPSGPGVGLEPTKITLPDGSIGYYSSHLSENDADQWKPVFMSSAKDVTVEGVCIANSAMHSFHLWGGRPTNPNKALWVKIVTWRGNGDGLGKVELAENCFIRTSDDCAYLKGSFKRCIFWTDNNGAAFHMAGTPTNVPLTVEDCDMLYMRAAWHKWQGGRVFSQRGEGSNQKIAVNVLVKNFRITDKYPTYPFFQLISPGGSSYSGITFENIQIAAQAVYGPGGKSTTNNHKNVIKGDANVPWDNITFRNVTIKGTKVTELNKATYFDIDPIYTSNIKFE